MIKMISCSGVRVFAQCSTECTYFCYLQQLFWEAVACIRGELQRGNCSAPAEAGGKCLGGFCAPNNRWQVCSLVFLWHFIWYSLEILSSNHGFFSVSAFCLKLKPRRTKMFPLKVSGWRNRRYDVNSCSWLCEYVLFIPFIHCSSWSIIFVFLLQELLDALRLELEENHAMELSNLRSTLTLSFKEDLEQVWHSLVYTVHKNKEMCVWLII